MGGAFSAEFNEEVQLLMCENRNTFSFCVLRSNGLTTTACPALELATYY